MPNKNNPDELFTKIFRNINYQGKSLTPLESRRSLYYTNSKYANFFEGKIADKDILCGLKLSENSKPTNIDFVRYLASLSQYSKTQNTNNVMYRYSRDANREEYYVKFVYHMLKIEDIEDFKGISFETTFADWETKYTKLMKTIQNIKPKIFDSEDEKFTSWIDMDYWLFGLLYWVLFENKTISNIEKLTNEIKERIEKVKNDEYYENYKDYKRTPNTLWKIRDRLQQSIEIYGKYINE